MSEYPKITLRAARVNAGLTQEDVARELRISRQTLANWEEGRGVPPWTVVKELESMYNFPADLIIFLPQYKRNAKSDSE